MRLPGNASVPFRSLIALYLLSPLALLAGDAAPAEKAPAFPPAGRILDCVRQFTGLDDSFTIARTESVIVSDGLPYLREALGNRKGIRVRLAPGKVKWGRPIAEDDPFLRRFTVYLDAEAKQVFAITSRVETSPAGAGAGAESPREETSMPFHWRDRYFPSVVPATVPKIPFVEAVKASFGGPLQALEINGYYLTSNYAIPGGTPRRPIWVIEKHGLPEIPMPMPVGVDVQWTARRRGHTQNGIDATTGSSIFGSAENSGKSDQ